VGGWIAEAQTERDRALAHIPATVPSQAPPAQLNADEITTVLDELGDIADALAEADPEHKSDLYRDLRLHLTYRPDTKTVQVIIDLDRDRWDLVGVEGGLVHRFVAPVRMAGVHVKTVARFNVCRERRAV
jgi:hypothetical protein